MLANRLLASTGYGKGVMFGCLLCRRQTVPLLQAHYSTGDAGSTGGGNSKDEVKAAAARSIMQALKSMKTKSTPLGSPGKLSLTKPSKGGVAYGIVQKFLAELELSKFDEPLNVHCRIRNIHDLHHVPDETLLRSALMSAEDVAKMREGLKHWLWRGTLEEAQLAAMQDSLAKLGVHGVDDLRNAQSLVALQKPLRPQEIQRLLLGPVWYPRLVVSRKGSAVPGDSIVIGLPRQSIELMVFWLETVGKEGNDCASLEDALGKVYLRLNPKASEEDWNVRWQQCANSENMHSDKQALMKELVGKCWPEMAHILPEYLGGFKDAQLLNILNGLLVPEPERFLEVLDIKESQTAQKKRRALKRLKKWKRFPDDLLSAFDYVFTAPQLKPVVAKERHESRRPKQTKKERLYYEHLAQVLQTSLDADGVKKAEKAKLQKASETLRRTFKVSGKDLPEHVQVSMKEWEENYARNLRDLKRVKEFFSRMKVWWKLNEMYGIGFPDFHKALLENRELQPEYKPAAPPDQLDRTI